MPAIRANCIKNENLIKNASNGIRVLHSPSSKPSLSVISALSRMTRPSWIDRKTDKKSEGNSD